MSDSRRNRGSSLRRALTLVEMAISIPLVGIALVAALNTVGASRVSMLKVNLGREGHLLAQALMSEILQQDYADPFDDKGSFGMTPAETATGDRSLFDDVDDYDKWSSKPPSSKVGTPFDLLQGWKRDVDVVWVSPSDSKLETVSEEGVKRITVMVKHNNIVVAKLVALKTIGLPPLEACCFGDGLCAALRVEACATQGGTAQGAETNCATTDCPTGPKVLLVVSDDTNPTAQELARQTMMGSWGFRVQLIAASASQSEFDTAVTAVDVAYVSVEVVATQLGTKLTAAAVGVVNSCAPLMDDLGLTSGTSFYAQTNGADVTDNTHFITSTFATGAVTLSTSAQWFLQSVSGLASGAVVLATVIGRESLFVFEKNAPLVGGTPAPARRVQLPWGDVSFPFSALNADSQTIMKNAIVWAASMDTVCGDASCDTGEECSCPADCGAAAAFEQPGATCNDGLDNDCNGLTDCSDLNCAADLACSCGNGTCDPGEDCLNCSTDCASKTKGPLPGRYCCGNGTAESAEGDGSICDGNY